MKGDLQRQNETLSKPEDTVDFRERISRSIWPSKLRLFGCEFLLARAVLSFGGKVSLLLYISAGWGWIAFCRRSSPLSSFLNAAFVGESSDLKKAENSGADASHIPALNTSSIPALHCFRTFRQQEGSPTNPDSSLLRKSSIFPLQNIRKCKLICVYHIITRRML